MHGVTIYHIIINNILCVALFDYEGSKHEYINTL